MSCISQSSAKDSKESDTQEQMPSYDSEILDNTAQCATQCKACLGSATLRITKLVGVEPLHIISVMECPSCNTKETTFFDADNKPDTELRIECNFDSILDLKREVNLNKMAYVSITADGLEYSFHSVEPEICIVESILFKAMDQIVNTFSIREGSSSVVPLDDSFVVDGQSWYIKKEANDQLTKFQRLIEEPRFRMIVSDKSGLSRVAPVGKRIFEMREVGLQSYDDDKVKHWHS